MLVWSCDPCQLCIIHFPVSNFSSAYQKTADGESVVTEPYCLDLVTNCRDTRLARRGFLVTYSLSQFYGDLQQTGLTAYEVDMTAIIDDFMVEVNADGKYVVEVYDVRPDTRYFLYGINSDSPDLYGEEVVSPLVLDSQRSYTFHCRHRQQDIIPSIAVKWTSVAFLVVLALNLLLICYTRMDGAQKEFADVRSRKEEMEALNIALKDANKAKDIFLATMSRELQAPVANIAGFLQSLKQTELDPSQADFLGEALSSCKGLMRHMGYIMDLTDLEAGRLTTNYQVFDIRELVDEIMEDYVQEAREKPDVEVAAVVHDAVPVLVVGDNGKIRQVIESLISNSLKFTNVGHIFICVRLGSDDLLGAHRIASLTGSHGSMNQSFAGNALSPQKLEDESFMEMSFTARRPESYTDMSFTSRRADPSRGSVGSLGIFHRGLRSSGTWANLQQIFDYNVSPIRPTPTGAENTFHVIFSVE
ncbi:hypothetical protein CBR_g55544, partial [Chara braunii]